MAWTSAIVLPPSLTARTTAKADEFSRLPNKEFDLDPHLTKYFVKQGKLMCDEVKKELAWISEKKRIGLQKITRAFFGNVLVERIQMKAFRSQHYVCSFRVTALSESATKSSAKPKQVRRKTLVGGCVNLAG